MLVEPLIFKTSPRLFEQPIQLRFETLVSGLTLLDADDRHVLGAAI